MIFYKNIGMIALLLGLTSHFVYAKEQKYCGTTFYLVEKYLNQYDSVECFKGNPPYAKVTKFEKTGTVEGFIDKSGKVIIPVKYRYTGDFSDGLVGVRNDEGFGYLNNRNEIVIPFDYGLGRAFEKGLALVENHQQLWGIINKRNHAVIPLIHISLHQLRKTDLYLASKNVGIPYELFEGLTPESHWRGRTRSKYEFMGVIDKHNKVIVPFEYQDLTAIYLYDLPDSVKYKGLYIAQKNDKYGVIKGHNTTVLPFIYDYLDTTTGGYIAKFEGKFGKLDKQGKVVIPFIYQDENLGQQPV